MLGADHGKAERGREGGHDHARRAAMALFGRPVTKGRIVNRVTAGTAMMIPIHDASMPTAFSHTGKNGRWVPDHAEQSRRKTAPAAPRIASKRP